MESKWYYSTCINNIQSHLSSHPKSFWNDIKSLKNYNNTPSIIGFNNISKTNAPEIS